MKRFLPVLVLMALIGAGCGGGNNNNSTATTGVSVTISPTTASIAGGATQQFTSTVTGSTNTAVTWQVNGTNGGDAIVGTINTSGLYTAPAVLPSTTTVGVTAVSQADTTKTATASVTLTAPAVTISVSPTTATVAAGLTQQFMATVTGGSTSAVTWSIQGGPNASLGSIDANGLYTAPASPPRGSITVVATAQANTAFTAAAPVTIQFGNASLKGSYVFFTTQSDNNSGSGFAFRAGEFQADGAGHITSGVNDANTGTGPAVNQSLTGTYAVGADGRGTVTMTDGSGAHSFSFALTSGSRGQLIQFDGGPVTAGYLRQQDQTAIASLSGTYVFSLFGDNSGPVGAVGQLVLTGGAITGVQDTNTSGSLNQQFGIVGGSYVLGANGRATAAIPNPTGTANYALYIVDASTFALINVDPGGFRTAGTAFAQTGAPFTNASLASSVYLVNGNAIPGNKPLAQVGRFDASAGSFAGGVFDINNGGVVTTSNSFGPGANYSVAANGRSTISTGSSNFIVWLSSTMLGVVLQSDASAVAAGLLLQQQSSFQSVTGGYAFVIAGAAAGGTPSQAIDGQLTTSGFGVLSGNEDVNISGTAPTFPPTPQGINGSLPPLTNGRASGTLSVGASAANFAFYFVTPDRFVLLSEGSGSVLSGTAERQCSDCTF